MTRTNVRGRVRPVASAAGNPHRTRDTAILGQKDKCPAGCFGQKDRQTHVYRTCLLSGVQAPALSLSIPAKAERLNHD